MAYTGVDNSSEYFNTVTYTGDGSADQSITGLGFKPDFLWIKRRNSTERHVLTNPQYPVVSGAYRWDDSADSVSAFGGGTGVAAFDTDGFTIKTSDATWNANGSTYVFWSWLGSGTTAASNTQGGTRNVTLSANQTAGFCTFRLLGGLDNTSTGHGLGVAPDVVLIKRENASVGFYVYHKDIGTEKYLLLGSHAVVASQADSFDAAPTSTLFTSGVNIINSTDWFNGYCFASKQGYSKFGSFLANANADGPFVYTGFKPAWVLRKATARAEPWMLMDNKRTPINPLGTILDPSSNAGDAVTPGDYRMDLLSNGFKLRSGNTSYGNHTSGVKYIYMAFAENPFVTSTGIPATAN